MSENECPIQVVLGGGDFYDCRLPRGHEGAHKYDYPVGETPDYMQHYAERWAEYVEKDGALDLDAVARELFDYSDLMTRAREVYVAVTGEQVSDVATMPEPIIDIVNERIDAAAASANQWWIADGALANGGAKILGPFATQALALEVRQYVEHVKAPATYWVDCDEAGEES